MEILSESGRISKSPFAEEKSLTALDRILEAHELLAFMAELVQPHDLETIPLSLGDSGRMGLGLLLAHCAQLTIDAFGELPANHKGADNE